MRNTCCDPFPGQGARDSLPAPAPGARACPGRSCRQGFSRVSIHSNTTSDETSPMDARTRMLAERIVQKCEMLIDRVEFIDRHIAEAILTDRILRKAMYKEFQEAVEAATDICALVRRSLDSSAQDDYSNVDYLVEREIIPADLGRSLKEANGLRNRLVHEYDGVNDRMAYNSITRLTEALRTFSGVILEWLPR